MDKDFVFVNLREFKEKMRRIFSTRKIIVMSGDKVGQYNFCFRKQLAILCLIVGVSSVVSFFLGSYLSVRTALEDKKKEFFTISLENNKLENQFDVLKKDIQRLNINDKKLDDYSKFILKQYKTGEQTPEHELSKKDEYNTYVNRILERVNYLEDSLQYLVHENKERDDLINLLQVKTNDKITEFDKIIRKTGIKTRRFKNKNPLEIYEEKYKPEENKGFWGKNFISRNTNIEDKVKEDKNSQGGPYQPVNFETLDKSQQKIIGDVDKMVKMHNILSALPVNKPYGHNKFYISSRYGKRSDPFTGRLAMHSGIDFVAPQGQDNIEATQLGVVTYSGRRGAYGNLVEIDHGYGLRTRYGHLEKIFVKKGQVVKKGEVIAEQGNTGRSTGEHLHYEVRFDNRAINPVRFFRLKDYVSKQTQ